MSQTVYPNFCPIAMASTMLEPRWTLLVLSELWAGASRFNEIQRGVPGMSPALLSKRLKDMEAKGLVQRRDGTTSGHAEYFTTPIADELEPLVQKLGEWAHRNINCDVSLQHLDARSLMWNIRRKINRLELPPHRCVIQFTLDEPHHETADYWLIFKPGVEPDLCYSDPAFAVDLFIVSSLRALTSAWMGHTSFEAEIESGRIVLIGHPTLARTLTKWLIRSRYATLEKALP